MIDPKELIGEKIQYIGRAIELWRFFEPFENEPHFVVTGCGIEE